MRRPTAVAIPLVLVALALPGCPLLELTGLPCPTCGATRAIYYLLQGDPTFLHYNVVWAAVAVLAVAMAAATGWRALRGHEPLRVQGRATAELVAARPGLTVAAALALALAGWLAALINIEWIRA